MLADQHLLTASNISLLTTIQSALADDLNAYANVSWFASAYLVCLLVVARKKSVIEEPCPDRHVKHYTPGGQVMSDLPAAKLCTCLEFALHHRRRNHILSTNAARLSLRPCLDGRRYGNLRKWRPKRLNSDIGAAGNFPAGIITIVSLTKVKRRGLFMGMMNAGFTAGIAFGAVLAGLLEPAVGWV